MPSWSTAAMATGAKRNIEYTFTEMGTKLFSFSLPLHPFPRAKVLCTSQLKRVPPATMQDNIKRIFNAIDILFEPHEPRPIARHVRLNPGSFGIIDPGQG
eukprot:3149742-Amphidinium_carterae.1